MGAPPCLTPRPGRLGFLLTLHGDNARDGVGGGDWEAAIDGVLLGLFKRGEEPQTLSSDLLGIVKTLSFYKKPRVVLRAFN